MRVRRHHKPIPSMLLAALFAPATMSAAWGAPPSLPPLMFQPYGFQQQLLPGQPDASFITPKPIAPMMPLFNMPAMPFGELGHNLTGSPTQSVPHRQPISPDPLPGGSARDAVNQRPMLLPAPGFSKGPAHRRPLGW